SAPVDPTVNLSLSPFDPYSATFDVTMTFTTEQTYSDVGGTGRTLTTNYGTPTFSAIPLMQAAPLIIAGDTGAETNLYGQAFEQVQWNSNGSSSFGRGAYLHNTVQRSGDVKCRCSVICGQSPARSTNIAVGLFSRERHG